MRCPVYNMNRNQAPPLIGGNKQSIVQLKKHEHLIKHGDAGEWRGGGISGVGSFQLLCHLPGVCRDERKNIIPTPTSLSKA